MPVEVDYSSEFRYRQPIVDARTLAIAITQSGETADTLGALREAKQHGARSLAICNVVGSMATREADGTVYTHAGPEIGVASTKAFTSQLVALHLLAICLGQARGTLDADRGADAPRASSISCRVGIEERAARSTPRSRRSREPSTSIGAISCTSAAASTTRSRSKAR